MLAHNFQQLKRFFNNLTQEVDFKRIDNIDTLTRHQTIIFDHLDNVAMSSTVNAGSNTIENQLGK
jgi:hypothetical protein